MYVQDFKVTVYCIPWNTTYSCATSVMSRKATCEIFDISIG